MTINITDKAKEVALSSLQSRGNGIGLRLGVKPSGCSSYAYVLEFADNKNIDDKVFKFGKLSVFVDKKSLVYLSGTILDYQREGLNEGFKFINPNAKDECGCGESFNV